jgi:hypothetical protein
MEIELKRLDEIQQTCQEIGHMWTWMPKNSRYCLRCGKFEQKENKEE